MNLIEATQNFIARLTGIADRIDSALADRASAQARISELEVQLAEAPNTARMTELEGQISTLTTRAETAEASLATANEQLGTFDQRVTEAANAEAARIIASNGHAPVTIPGNSGVSKTITRAEFNSMNHADRNAHFRNGGKISQE